MGEKGTDVSKDQLKGMEGGKVKDAHGALRYECGNES